MQCDVCDFDNRPGLFSCERCGAALAILCARCGFRAPAGSRFCGQCGAALGDAASSADAAASGSETAVSTADGVDAPPEERRQVTVVFSDVVGSTALAEQLDLEDFHAVLHRYQAVCGEAAQRFGGYVAQYLGDGVLIYFGYPQAHEDDARRAIHAALGIVEAMGRANETWRRDHGLEVGIRLGIHTGQVLVTEIGAGESRERLALGSVPNLAARLQRAAGPGQVIIGPATEKLVRGFFNLRPLGHRSFKGFEQPVEVFQIVGVRDVRSAFEIAARRGLTRLVGRGEELSRLSRCLEEALQGRSRVVSLVGEPGIGKSRLVHVLRQRAEATGFMRLIGRCSPYTRTSAFEPVIDLCRRLFRFRRGDSASTKLAKLEAELEPLELHGDVLPAIAEFLSLEGGEGSAAPAISPRSRKQQILETLADLLDALARREPLLLIVEDLHWADPSTLELLELLLERQPQERILVLLTSRPSFTPPWEGSCEVIRIVLDRLGSDEIAAMTRDVAHGKALPPELLRQVVEKSDGVPLFAEELTKMFLESDLLRETGDRFELAGALPERAIPATVRDFLSARLDRMAEAKDLAQWGALLGRDFSFDRIHAISGLAEPDLRRGLDRLVAAELLFERGSLPASRYFFKHALIRDVAYESLPKRLYRERHARIARVLIESFPEVAAEQPELVARHATEAAEIELALEHWQRAGALAAQRSAFVEARQHLEEGLALLPKVEAGSRRDRFELAMRAALGAALAATRGFAAPEVNAAFARALELCQRHGDVPELFWVLWGTWRFQLVRANLSEALELARRLIPLVDDDSEPDRPLAAYLALGSTLVTRGEVSEAHDVLSSALAFDAGERERPLDAGTGEDFGVSIRCWSSLCLWHLGFPDRALEASVEAIALARRVSHPPSLLFALSFHTFLAFRRRDPESGREPAETVIALCREQDYWWEPAVQVYLGWARAMVCPAGDSEALDREIAHIREAIRGYRATGARLNQTQFLVMLTEVLVLRGASAEAKYVLDQARGLIRDGCETTLEAEVHRLLGETHAALSGEVESAETHLRRALEIARRQGAKTDELRAALSLSRLWAGHGRSGPARELLAEACEAMTESSDSTDLREARGLLGELTA